MRNAPGVIVNWDVAIFKPPIFAVEAPYAEFLVVWGPGGHPPLKTFKNTGKVFRMHCIVCSPVLYPFHRLAKILQELVIDGFEFTVRGQDRNQTGYPVKCRACTSFVLL